MTRFVKSYTITNDQVLIRSWCLFLMKMKTFAFWLPHMSHKANLALFLNLIGDATVFSNIRIYASYLWAVMISTFFVVAWKRRFDENGASLSSTGLELNLLDLICCIFDTTVAMMLAWRLKHFSDTESSLSLGVRFSSKNLLSKTSGKSFMRIAVQISRN